MPTNQAESFVRVVGCRLLLKSWLWPQKARANEKDESLPDTICPDRTHTDASEYSVTYVAIVDE
jgi:hypothetical protein